MKQQPEKHQKEQIDLINLTNSISLVLYSCCPLISSVFTLSFYFREDQQVLILYSVLLYVLVLRLVILKSGCISRVVLAELEGESAGGDE